MKTSVPDIRARPRSREFTIILSAVNALVLLLRYIMSAVDGRILTPMYLVLIGALAVVLLLAASERRYRYGTHLLMAILFLTPHLLVLTDSTIAEDALVLTFVNVAVLMAYLFYETPVILSVAVASIVTMVFSGLLADVLWYELLISVGAVALVALVIVLALFVRQSDRERIIRQNLALQESESRLRALFESAFETLIIHDNDRIIDTNQAGEVLFGYSKAEIVGLPLSDLLMQTLSIPSIESAQKDKAIPFESVGVTKTGDAFPVEVLTKPYAYDGRQVQVSAVRDITYRKQVERNLRRQIAVEQVIANVSQRFANINADGMHAAVMQTLEEVALFVDVERSYLVVLRDDGSLIDKVYEWSPHDTGFSLVSLENRSLNEWHWWMQQMRYGDRVVLHDLHDLPEEATAERTLLEQAKVLSLVALPLRYQNRLIGFIGLDALKTRRDWSGEHLAMLQIVAEVVVNALERTRTEVALRQSERRFALIFESSPVPIAIMSADLRYLTVNASYLELTGYQHEEIIGKTPDELNLWGTPDQREDSLAWLAQTPSVHDEEAFLRTRDGDQRVVIAFVERIHLDDSDALLTIVHDVTERRRSQEHQRHYEFQQERLRILNQFISDTSHDFKTPLSVMRTSLFLIRKKTEDTGGTWHNHLDTLDTQITRIHNLLEDFMTMAKLSERDYFDFRAHDLREVIESVIESYKDRVRAKNQRITFTPENLMPPVLIDRDALARALDQIIQNAVTYTPEAGTIQVRTINSDNDMLIEIEDDGIGIPPDDLPHIFTTFYRGDKARSTHGGNSGLGLSIAEEVVKAHEGDITVESTPGEGSVFRVRLPVNHGD